MRVIASKNKCTYYLCYLLFICNLSLNAGTRTANAGGLEFVHHSNGEVFLKSPECNLLKLEVQAIFLWAKARGEAAVEFKIDCATLQPPFEVDVTQLLPKKLAKIYGEKSKTHGFNCLGNAAYDCDFIPYPRFVNESEWNFHLQNHCIERPVDEKPAPGDVVFIRKRTVVSPKAVHAFIYIGETGCTKNGWFNEAPCLIQPIEEILDLYQVDHNPACRYAHGVPEGCDIFANYFTCQPPNGVTSGKVQEAEDRFSVCAQSTGVDLERVKEFATLVGKLLGDFPMEANGDPNYLALKSLEDQIYLFREGLLQEALDQNNPGKIHAVLEEWDDVNRWFDIPPLTRVALHGKPDYVRLLLKKKANPDTKDFYGNTALGAAAMVGQIHSVHELLLANPEVNLKNREGWTPLNLASDQGHLKVVQALVEKGANAEIPNDEGFTPLARAVWQGRIEVVKYLLTVGVNPFAMVKDGRSISDLALSSQDSRHKLEIVKIILEYKTEYRPSIERRVLKIK